jgi:hypothetical protein
MRPDEGPTKWVDEWPLPGLSAVDRIKIKAVLLKAHAAYHRTDWRDYSERAIAPMQQAFSGIASVLFEANLLTVELLENQLRLFVLESAAAGDWVLFSGVAQDEQRTEIFPGYLGHATRWKAFNERWFMVFAAEIAEWHSRLLDKSVQTSTQTSTQAPLTLSHADRKAFSDAYLAAFPTVKILDVCWAAGQRYSEWKRWLRHDRKAKDGSAPDRAFRAILTSGKAPSEYRKQPLPRGWK